MILKSYYVAFLLYAATFLLCVFRLKRSESGAGLAAFLINGITLGLLYSGSGQLPVFNLFEGFLLTAFILGGISLYYLSVKDHHPRLRLWIWLEILVLFLILLIIPKQTTLSAYDHDYLFIILFHLFRVIAFALMLYASACFIQFRVQRRIEQSENARTLTHRGRNFLVLGAVFFLSGEYVGIIWSQNGWGDFWHWNSGFFQSTMIVLYLMIALHIPGKDRKAEGVRSIIGGFSGFIMLTMMVIRSFY
jgi:ABC-type transport system involved in cytochrome c biogenesis permease subunit